jgi:modulator of FtsH protease HflK
VKEPGTPLITRQEATALVSCTVNLLLTIAKFFLFYNFVKSVSLKAEAWHSLSDIGSSFVVFLALYLSRRKMERTTRAKEAVGEGDEPKRKGLFAGEPEPEEGEPKRSAKPEDVVAIGIACLFLVVCMGIFWEVFQPTEVKTDHALLVAVGMLAMAYASYLLYKFEYRVGVESNSSGLIADGYHSRIDMYGSVLVAVALVSHWLGLGFADRIVAAFICLGILAHAIEVLAMAARHYLGKADEAIKPLEHGDHAGALADVYALTGKWGEGLSRILTSLFAALLLIDRARPDLGRRVARRVVTVAVLAGVMLYALSGLYACKPGEQAFVERFGRPTTVAPFGPGLHYRWPWPFERTVKIPVDKVRTLQMGSGALQPNQPILWTNIHYASELRFLTGDERFLTMFAVVHYRIEDLWKFLYACSNPDELLALTCQARMRELVGSRAFFDCLSKHAGELEGAIQESLDTVGRPLGIEVLNVCIRDMHPPQKVAPAFEAVISATRRMHATVDRANAYAKRVIPRAKGEAAQRTARAEAYMGSVIARATAETREFLAQQEKYALAKDITRIRLYLEMLERTITRTRKWVVLTDGQDIPLDLWFRKGGEFWRWLPSGPVPGGPTK